MNYILFDDTSRINLLPFTHTRPVADIRCGIFTMRERWERCIEKAFEDQAGGASTTCTTGTLTEAYLQGVYPLNAGDSNIFINGGVFASKALAAAVLKLEAGQSLVADNKVLAARPMMSDMAIAEFNKHIITLPAQYFNDAVYALANVWDIFAYNDRAIREDFELITEGRKSAPLPEGVTVTGAHNLFIEEGANIYAGCIINAATGPVYIGKDTEVLEGVLMRGPIAVCDHVVIKMGAKIYGGTTFGPGCKVGGEINNTVFFSNSNKSHDGSLGNAVIGEWCNLGADTNCSNLKNNYAEIKIWHEGYNRSVPTGLTFCGLMMGDHSKCGINTMFNTATVVGVSCNIFGAGFPDRYVPSFSWGGIQGTKLYKFAEAMDTATKMMARRNKKLSEAETEMFRYIFNNSKLNKDATTN